MKRYLYIFVLILTLSQFNISYSQPFPNINNDTTYLRRIKVEEGTVPEYPIYIDTINMGHFTKHALYDMRNQERFYSNFAIIVSFKNKYFLDNDSILIYNTNLSTNNLQLASILDSVSLNFSHYKLLDMHFNDSIYKGLTFILQFDSIVNLKGVYDFFQDTSIVDHSSYFNLPFEYLSIQNDRSLLGEKINSSLIFPNPSSDKISLDLGGVDVADLVVYDILGNEIMSILNYTNKSEIDISNLSIGTYTIQVQAGTGSITQRLLVNR